MQCALSDCSYPMAWEELTLELFWFLKIDFKLKLNMAISFVAECIYEVRQWNQTLDRHLVEPCSSLTTTELPQEIQANRQRIFSA